MSRRILTQLQNYGKTLQYSAGAGLTSKSSVSATATTTIISRNFSDSSSTNGSSNDKTTPTTLGQTTILVQQGCDIQELPVILRKMKSDEFATICTDKLPENDNVQYSSSQPISHQEYELRPEEVIIMIDNCTSVIGTMSVISQVPERFLTPEIAAHTFDKLIRNEGIIGLKNLEHSSPVFEKLLNCILKNGDHKMLLDFMEVLKKFLDLEKTVQRFCDELLLRNSDGILNVIEICECIERFVDCKQQDAAEKFWTGFTDAEKTINDKNIKFIYKILPKLKVSRRMVVGVIEQRIGQVWWNLTPDAVSESILALTESRNGGPPPTRTMQYFARWLNTNIHAVTETHLETIVSSLSKLDFSNSQVEKALERYVKAKGIKIKSQHLIGTILEHCVHFR